MEDYESGEDVSLAFHEKDYGRTFLSPDTNREFAYRYIERALREPETDIIGKGIIYCVSRAQAAQLTNELNKAAEAKWPGKYQSNFAVQITHDVDRATEMGRAFANQDGLNGADSTIPGYKTSKTRVCVTVAMMTTGYDCPDLLNLGFCRPVKSSTDYIQMKGRGTRLYDFTENFTDQLVRDQVSPRPKEHFLDHRLLRSVRVLRRRSPVRLPCAASTLRRYTGPWGSQASVHPARQGPDRVHY